MKPLHALVPMLHVESVLRAIAFYERVGFATRDTHTPEGRGEPVWAWLVSGGAQLMLALADTPVDHTRQGVLFYAYSDDLALFHRELSDAGLAPSEIRNPFYAPGGEFRLIDPDGYVTMVTHT